MEWFLKEILAELYAQPNSITMAQDVNLVSLDVTVAQPISPVIHVKMDGKFITASAEKVAKLEKQDWPIKFVTLVLYIVTLVRSVMELVIL